MIHRITPPRGLTTLVAFAFFAIANASLFAMPLADSTLGNSTSLSLTSGEVLDLNGTRWRLIGQDFTNWNDSLLTITELMPDGTLLGQFDWISSGRSRFGRELFEGQLNADLTFTLHGFQMNPHPDYGGPRGVVLADYAGRFTQDGLRIVDGTWIGRNGVRGTWESVAIPESSSLALVGVGGTCVFAWRMRRQIFG